MRPKSVLLLMLALGCGLVATIGINQYLKKPAQTVQAEVPVTSIVVAVQEISRGTPIKEGMIALKNWPAANLPQGALTDAEKVLGRVASQRMFSGEPVLDGKLDTEGNTRLIPEGMRLVTIKVNVWSSVYGFVQPDDHVDIIMTVRGNNTAGTLGKTILEDVLVWALDQELSRDEGKPQAVARQGVTLLVTPKQAVMLALADNQGGGALWLSLRSNNDRASGTPSTVSMDELIRGGNQSGPSLAENDDAKEEEEPSDAGQGLREWLKGRKGQDPQEATSRGSSVWLMKILRGAAVQEEKEFPLQPSEQDKPAEQASLTAPSGSSR